MNTSKRKVYLLRWNPSISSFTAEAYDKACAEFGPQWYLDWSFYEHDKVRPCDVFFMLRQGENQPDPGIYFGGCILSFSYAGKDWRGTGHTRWYADLEAFDTRPIAEGPHIATEALEAAIPDVDWRRGHSGELLTPEQGSRLIELWLDAVPDSELGYI